jgi:hypothetical protein
VEAVDFIMATINIMLVYERVIDDGLKRTAASEGVPRVASTECPPDL